MNFGKRKLVSDDGPSSGGHTEDGRWRYIRDLSVVGFVNKVAKALGNENDQTLRNRLYSSALHDGEDVQYRGITYTPAMQLDLYRRPIDRM